MNLEGKVAIITGAGGGMGSVLAGTLINEGATLVLIEKELSLFEHLKDIIDGPKTTKLECDLSDINKVEDLARKLTETYEKVDFLFNVAGIGIYKGIEELSLKEWQDSVNVNLNAPFVLTKALLPSLKKSEKGLIVNFGSGMGKFPSAKKISYSSSKFGLRGFSLSLSKELKGTNVDCVLLTLGSVMTNFGTGGIELRKKLRSEGKKYLEPEQVISKLMKIIKADVREPEYVIYPEGYGENPQMKVE